MQELTFPALLASEAFVHKRCCYPSTKDLLSMCTTDHDFPVVGPSGALQKQTGFQEPISPLSPPAPSLEEGKDTSIPLYHGVLQPLNPCVATVYSLPLPPVAPLLDVPLKDVTMRWENLRVIGNLPC